MREITRRRLMQMAAAAAVSNAVGARADNAEQGFQKNGAVGTSPLYSGSPIEIYTNTLSAVAGDELTLHVSTTAKHFNIQIARIGLEESVVWTKAQVRPCDG